MTDSQAIHRFVFGVLLLPVYALGISMLTGWPIAPVFQGCLLLSISYRLAEAIDVAVRS